MHAALLALSLASQAPINVMSYNIWVGGTRFQPLSQTIRVIRESKADVVGIQEPGDNLKAIADDLKWNRSDKAAIVTRHEILEDWKVEGNRWGGAKLKTADGFEFVVYNDHFNPYPYGPYEARDGNAKTPEALAEVERAAGRVAQMDRVLASVRDRATRRTPILFVGDFNTPSHLDWTEATKARNFGIVMRWPVTVAAERDGFIDSFRAIHPDPKLKPAFTWSPGYPVGTLEANDVMDRIDFVLHRGPLRPTAAKIVGETGPMTDMAFDPWPSDHRAVWVSFSRAR